jgi:NADH-quinone oxidoreductase subunit M
VGDQLMDDFPWLTLLMVVPLVGALVIAALPSAMADKAKQTRPRVLPGHAGSFAVGAVTQFDASSLRAVPARRDP